MDPQKLHQLAKACRKAGIKHYKDADVEFTLTDESPKKQKAAKQDNTPDTPVETDIPSPEALMFWSAQGIDPASTGEA
jgi:hypothetical protein